MALSSPLPPVPFAATELILASRIILTFILISNHHLCDKAGARQKPSCQALLLQGISRLVATDRERGYLKAIFLSGCAGISSEGFRAVFYYRHSS